MVEIYKINNTLNLPIKDFMYERINKTYSLKNFEEFAKKKKKKNCKMGLEL